jgi:Transposase and inactivated derivatives
MTAVEQTELQRMARSSSEEYRYVERARAILAVYRGLSLAQAGAAVGRGHTFASKWLIRFEKDGLKGLEDEPRSGRPPVISEEDKGRIIAAARTLPDALEQPFGHWTLDRLNVYAKETLHIAISRAHIGRVLYAEGLRWYQEQTDFSERVDPQFAEKRGPSLHSTGILLPTPMSCV